MDLFRSRATRRAGAVDRLAQVDPQRIFFVGKLLSEVAGVAPNGEVGGRGGGPAAGMLPLAFQFQVRGG